MPDIFDQVAQENTPDPSMWKDPSKVLVTRDKITGAVQRWKLENGVPILIGEEKTHVRKTTKPERANSRNR